MGTFYLLCILLLIQYESVYCESPSTTATFNTITAADKASTTDTGIIEYYLRLAHGKFGRVEIKMRNIWAYVCSDNFTDADARVLCREIGYNGGFAYILSDPYRRELNPLYSSLGCTGTEKTILECGDFTDASNCDPDKSAAAYCYNNSGFDFRLANVSTSGYGHVEMALDGEWRPFCALRNLDNNQRVLDLLCQQMGFSHGSSEPRIKKNPVENIWVPYIYGCREGASLFKSCAFILTAEEVPYDPVNWRNNWYRSEYYVCTEGYLPSIKCF